MTMQTEMTILDNGNLCLHVPLKINYKNGRKVIISPETMKENENSPLSSNQAMIQMLTRGNAWMRLIEEGKITSISELVEKTGYHRTHIWRHLQVANLSPSLTEAILEGNEPDEFSLTKLKKPIPEKWNEQLACLHSKI
jgi:hypothetical protein